MLFLVIFGCFSVYFMDKGKTNSGPHMKYRLQRTVENNFRLWDYIVENRSKISEVGIENYFAENKNEFCEYLTESAFRNLKSGCFVFSSSGKRGVGGFFIDEESWVPRLNVSLYKERKVIRERADFAHFEFHEMSPFILLDTDPMEWVDCEFARDYEGLSGIRELVVKICGEEN